MMRRRTKSHVERYPNGGIDQRRALGTAPREDMMMDKAIAAVLRTMIARSRRRAAKSRIAHTLPDDYASLLYEQQQGRCDVTGLHFSMQRFPEALVKHPFAPSLDRRDSRGGYTVDNVRLVYVSVNFGMGQWGQEVYLHCARAAVEHDVKQGFKKPAELTDWQARQRGRIGATETPAKSVIGDDLSRQRKPAELSDWEARQRDRIDAAETLAKSLIGDDLSRQRRHIASLKRNLTLGPQGLARAAERAAGKRASHGTEAG